MKKIFLTGGTGLLGIKFLEIFPKNDFEITLGSRSNKNLDFNWQYFDLENTDTSLNLEGFDIVIHLASNTRNLNANSDVIGAQYLLDAVQKADIQHFIFMSIVGVDTVPVKYFRTKKQVEELIQEVGINYSIIRSTQFMEFFEKEIQDKIKRKITFMPNLKYQPIETTIVAQKLIETCRKQATNTIEEIGGMKEIYFKDGIKTYQKIIGNNSIILSIPNFLLGQLGSALTTSNRMKESCSWEEYLKTKKD